MRKQAPSKRMQAHIERHSRQLVLGPISSQWLRLISDVRDARIQALGLAEERCRGVSVGNKELAEQIGKRLTDIQPELLQMFITAYFHEHHFGEVENG